MNKQPNRAHGFSLVELIGVLAVIAILASVAVPNVVGALRDAKVGTVVESLGTFRTAVTKFYSDTGKLPVHDPASTRANQKQLTKKPATGVAGWNGPYIDQEMRNPFDPLFPYRVLTSANARNKFDFDGDGTVDQTSPVSYIHIDVPTVEAARKISDAIDKDASDESGKKAWYAAGRVRTHNSKPGRDGRVRLYIYLGSG